MVRNNETCSSADRTFGREQQQAGAILFLHRILADIVALADIPQRCGRSGQARRHCLGEPKRGLHLSTAEWSFCLAEVSQLGLQREPPALAPTPQLALGSILLSEQAP